MLRWTTRLQAFNLFRFGSKKTTPVNMDVESSPAHVQIDTVVEVDNTPEPGFL